MTREKPIMGYPEIMMVLVRCDPHTVGDISNIFDLKELAKIRPKKGDLIGSPGVLCKYDKRPPATRTAFEIVTCHELGDSHIVLDVEARSGYL